MFLIPKSYWEIKNTKNKGRGVFAKKTISKGTVIGDYVGKLIPYQDVDFDEEEKSLYLMYYNDEAGIYPDLIKPGVHLLNHSCSPNCWIFNFKHHTLVFALKDIGVGTELTISYLLPPKMNCDPCSHKCFCKSKRCTGSMHLTENGYKKWQKFQDKEEAKRKQKRIRKEKVLKPLAKYPKFIPQNYIVKIRNLKITKLSV